MDTDWRSAGAGAYAWFGATSHAHAAELIGLLPDGPLPDLDVRADGVRVGVRGDRAVLPAISAAARAVGLVPDPTGLQELGLRVGTAAPVTGFWRTALHYAGDDVSAGGDMVAGEDVLADGWRRCPVVRFERSEEARPLRNRIHVDSGCPGPIDEALVALKGEGGREAFTSEWYSTMADADGNEIDLVPGGALGEDVEDWRAMFGAMACYPGASAAQVAEVAGAAARLADEAGIPLMIDVRPEGLVFDSGKDRWEIVAGFVDLARAVQGAARAAGLTADNSGIRFVQVVIDAVDIPAVSEFWRVALGYGLAAESGMTEMHDPRQLNPVVMFQPMDATETDRRQQRNRTRFELRLPADQLAARAATALAAGGRTVGEPTPDRHHLADPEGNELVLIAPA